MLFPFDRQFHLPYLRFTAFFFLSTRPPPIMELALSNDTALVGLLPDEVLLTEVLPKLGATALVLLGKTCRRFHALVTTYADRHGQLTRTAFYIDLSFQPALWPRYKPSNIQSVNTALWREMVHKAAPSKDAMAVLNRIRDHLEPMGLVDMFCEPLAEIVCRESIYEHRMLQLVHYPFDIDTVGRNIDTGDIFSYLMLGFCAKFDNLSYLKRLIDQDVPGEWFDILLTRTHWYDSVEIFKWLADDIADELTMYELVSYMPNELYPRSHDKLIALLRATHPTMTPDMLHIAEE